VDDVERRWKQKRDQVAERQADPSLVTVLAGQGFLHRLAARSRQASLVLPRKQVLLMYEWMSEALCREIGGEIFFPADPNNWREAKIACSMCPVQNECLEYALKENVLGIWGGTTERDRQAIRRKAKKAA
jgi:WhiB family redox-sensing transcriptional regulator